MLGPGAKIELRHCTVEFLDWGCMTHFRDGTSFGAHPHETHRYYVVSHKCGHGDDIMGFCRYHEFFHSFTAQRLHDEPSYVLWTLAHKMPQNRGDVVYEEMAAQQVHQWVMTGDEPIISGHDWHDLKTEALFLLSSG